jgi:hypothetical protein
MTEFVCIRDRTELITSWSETNYDLTSDARGLVKFVQCDFFRDDEFEELGDEYREGDITFMTVARYNSEMSARVATIEIKLPRDLVLHVRSFLWYV